MNIKALVILLTVLTGLGSLAVWDYFYRKPAQEETEELSKRLFSLSEDSQIESIELQDGGRGFTFQCLSKNGCGPEDNSKWQIIHPVNVSADDSKLNRLASSLGKLSSSETVSPDEGASPGDDFLRDFGLDKKSRTSVNAKKTVITLKGGERHTVFYGMEHPFGLKIFTAIANGDQVDESKVYVVPLSIKQNLDKKLDDWRDKSLMTLGSHDVTGFDIQSAKGKVSGQKHDGKWTIYPSNGTVKNGYAGDPEGIDGLLNTATLLKAKAFPTEDKKSVKAQSLLKGTQHFAQITLRHGDNESITLAVRRRTTKDKKADVVYATLSTQKTLYELANVPANLEKSLSELRQANLISSLDRFSAQQLDFSGKPLGAHPVILKKTEGKWTQTSPTPKEINSDRIGKLLDKLQGRRIKSFISKSKRPKGESSGIRLKLVTKDNKTKDIFFWRSNGKLYARHAEDPRGETYEVESAISTSLPWSSEFFYESDPPKKAPQ